MNAIVSELSEATGIAATGNLRKALEKMVRAVGDEDFDVKIWDKMSTKAQQWVDDAMKALEAGEEFEMPEGDDEAKPAKGKGKKAKANGKANGKHAATEDDDNEPAPKKGKAAKGKAGKAEKPAKAAAKDKAKASGAKRGRGSPPPFSDTAKITILVKAPHREGSLIAERYAKLKQNMTVGAARKAGLSFLDLRCDVERGNLKIK